MVLPFGRDNDRGQWLNSVFDESVEFIILDLLQLGKDKPIVVDTFMEPEFLKAIADHNRIVTLSEPQRARSETLDTVVKAANHYLQQVKHHNVQYFVRNAATRKEEILANIDR